MSEPTTGEQCRNHKPLRGRVALVTGVSRRAGIGHAVARRLATLGADLVLHHHAPHDADQPWRADDLTAVLAGFPDAPHFDGDLAAPGAPERLVSDAVSAAGKLDVLICNHARSGGDGPLGALDAAALDGHWAANTRSAILFTQAFAAQHDGGPGGRVILLTSGQHLGPMPGEIAYAATKGALAAVTATIADQLAHRGFTVNTVNPGPVDTGYAAGADHEAIRRRFPTGRWGEPDDAARLIAWLSTDDAAWITGQVINSEGGVPPVARITLGHRKFGCTIATIVEVQPLRGSVVG